jgi:hypothetical protein
MVEDLMTHQSIRPQTCETKDETFVFAGRTTEAKFSIYDLRYRFLTHPGGVYHGDQRIVVFQGKKYVGHYYVLPVVTVAVRGKYVLLQGNDDREPVRLDFSKKPPRRILVNGEPEEFAR